MDDLLQIISFVVSFFALLAAIFIPKRIMWHQIFADLNEQYFSVEFGQAVKGVCDFFTDRCDNDVEKIEKEYWKRYENDFKFEKMEKNGCANQLDFKNTLHFQRRLLAQFYFLLDECAGFGRVGKKTVKQFYFKSEIDLLKILFYMNIASKNNPKIYKDISTDDRFLPPVPKEDEINIHLRRLASLLK